MSSNGLKAVLNAVGKKQSIDQDFTLPVKNGKGSKVESKYTLGKTITGYFQIKSPGNGVWDGRRYGVWRITAVIAPQVVVRP